MVFSGLLNPISNVRDFVTSLMVQMQFVGPTYTPCGAANSVKFLSVDLAGRFVDAGGIDALPTDSSYALVCHLDDKSAVDRLRRIRGVDDKHHLTLL